MTKEQNHLSIELKTWDKPTERNNHLVSFMARSKVDEAAQVKCTGLLFTPTCWDDVEKLLAADADIARWAEVVANAYLTTDALPWCARIMTIEIDRPVDPRMVGTVVRSIGQYLQARPEALQMPPYCGTVLTCESFSVQQLPGAKPDIVVLNGFSEPMEKALASEGFRKAAEFRQLPTHAEPALWAASLAHGQGRPPTHH